MGKIPKAHTPSTQHNYNFLQHEKSEIEKHYDFLHPELVGSTGHKTLHCKGQYNCAGVLYKYIIKYDGIKPLVYIQDPDIPYDIDAHMFKDKHLCLYDNRWNSFKQHIYSDIIPWIHEWCVGYEIYKITHKWELPFTPHNQQKEDAI